MIVTIRCGNRLVLRVSSRIKTMQRWTARFLLLIMLVPAVGPIALARVADPSAMHCMRRPLQSAPTAEPVMHCHGGAMSNEGTQSAGSPTPFASSSAASVRSLDCCCNHDCCRGVKTSEWASLSPAQQSFANLRIEPATIAPLVTATATTSLGPDSARAPPRRYIRS
jgi:hypothetical protein